MNTIRVSNSWIQTRPDASSGLAWVQTVCKGYQQTTIVGNGKELNENIEIVESVEKCLEIRQDLCQRLSVR